MNNFEKACLTACENQVNSIKLTEPPVYSKKHKEKIELIANGKSTFATKANYIKISLLYLLCHICHEFVYTDSCFKHYGVFKSRANNEIKRA